MLCERIVRDFARQREIVDLLFLSGRTAGNTFFLLESAQFVFDLLPAQSNHLEFVVVLFTMTFKLLAMLDVRGRLADVVLAQFSRRAVVSDAGHIRRVVQSAWIRINHVRARERANAAKPLLQRVGIEAGFGGLHVHVVVDEIVGSVGSLGLFDLHVPVVFVGRMVRGENVHLVEMRNLVTGSKG